MKKDLRKSRPRSGSGIVAGVLIASLFATPTMAQPQAGSPVGTQGKVASGGTNAGNPVKTGCVYNSTLPSPAPGQIVDCQASPKGGGYTSIIDPSTGYSLAIQYANPLTGYSNNVNTFSELALNRLYNGSSWDASASIQSALGSTTGVGVAAVEDAPVASTHINTATTTLIKTGAGVLHELDIGTCTSSGTITGYDNTTATAPVKFVFTCPASTAGQAPIYRNMAFSTGLVIVTSAAIDTTVLWK